MPVAAPDPLDPRLPDLCLHLVQLREDAPVAGRGHVHRAQEASGGGPRAAEAAARGPVDIEQRHAMAPGVRHPQSPAGDVEAARLSEQAGADPTAEGALAIKDAHPPSDRVGDEDAPVRSDGHAAGSQGLALPLEGRPPHEAPVGIEQRQGARGLLDHPDQVLGTDGSGHGLAQVRQDAVVETDDRGRLPLRRAGRGSERRAEGARGDGDGQRRP